MRAAVLRREDEVHQDIRKGLRHLWGCFTALSGLGRFGGGSFSRAVPFAITLRPVGPYALVSVSVID